MSVEFNLHRRRFCGAAALTLAAAPLALLGCAQAAEETLEEPRTIRHGAHASFAPLKQINAGLLNVGYAEDGPPDGPAVVLLHGWPYDIQSYVEVAPLLASRGYR